MKRSKFLVRPLLVLFLLLSLLLSLSTQGYAANVKKGSTGTETRHVQYNLNFLGFNVGKVDSIAGDSTVSAIKAYQRSRGLSADGIAGKDTQAALKAEVKEAQQLLTDKGYFSATIDGVAGNKTISALKSFQSDNGLSATGVYDAKTEAKLTAPAKCSKHTRGTFLYEEEAHPHHGVYKCKVCGEAFTDKTTVTITNAPCCSGRPEEYTLTFISDGDVTLTQDVRIEEGKEYTIPEIKAGPLPLTKRCHVFLGWATSKNATAPKYYKGSTIKMTKDLTLYAVWEKEPVAEDPAPAPVEPVPVPADPTPVPEEPAICKDHKYTSAGGDLCTVCGYQYVPKLTKYARTMMVVKEDTPVRTTPYANSSKIVKELSVGDEVKVTHFFENAIGNTWYKTADGYYIFLDNLSTDCSLIYDAKGGSGAPKTVSAKTDSTLTVSTSVPTRTGYSFKGWETSSSKLYQPGESIKISGTTTLYAVWEKEEEETETCKAHKYTSAGGDYCTVCGYQYVPKMTSYDRIRYAAQATVAIRNQPYSKAGRIVGYLTAANPEVQVTHFFKNSLGNTWYKTADGNYIFVDHLTSTAPGTIKVTYNANANGSSVSNLPSTQKSSAGGDIKLSATIPKRAGYTFLGWATKASATKASFNPGVRLCLPDDITLYAVWEGEHDYDAYRRNVDTIKSSIGGENVCQDQINRIKKNGSTYQKGSGLCNISSVVTLLNRNLYYEGKASETQFTLLDAFSANGCKITHGPTLNYTPNKYNRYGYAYSGNTDAWACSINYTNASGTSYKVVNESKAVIDKNRGSLSYEEYFAKLLREHPEGICLRKKNSEGGHVFVITDYTLVDGKYQFYVQDPVNRYTGKFEGSYQYKTYGDTSKNVHFIAYIK